MLSTVAAGTNAQETLEVFSPGGADGRSIATGMFFANNRLVVAGRQTGLIFIYNTKTGRLADPGAPLKRISVDKCYEFWESEVRRHLLGPHGKVDRSNMPDEYGYLASEWSGHIEVPIVLLEKIHGDGN